MSYVELHATRRTRSSTAPPCRRSSPSRRPSSATRRSRSPTTTALYGSLEFAHAAKAFGVRPITGAELSLDRRLARDRPRRDAAGLLQPLPAHHDGVRAHSAEGGGRAAAAGARPAAARGTERRARLPLRLRAAGLAVRDPNAAARLAHAFGRDRFFVELQRPYERGDARRNAAAARARGDARRPDGRDRRRALAPPAPGAAPGRARGDQAPDVARRLRAGTARKPRERAPPAGGDGGALPRRSGERSRAPASSPSGSSST